MSKQARIRLWAGVAVIAVALVLLAASLLSGQSHPDTASAAKELGARVERRVNLLEEYVNQALTSSPDAPFRLENLPEDMVLYRYREDTLQSWNHQFPIRNDDIRSRTVVQRLGDARGNTVSPLSALTSTLNYVNYGPKWFLAKSVREGEITVIAGLEVVNELNAGSFNGVNPRFRLGDRYSVYPLTGSIGVPVVVNGAPVFKVTAEAAQNPERHDPLLFWISVLLLLGGTLLLLSVRPTIPLGGVVMAVQTAFIAGLYLYGQKLGQASQLFSPLLYADGAFFYSLGAVVLLNLLIVSAVLSLYLVRKRLLEWFRRKDSRWAEAVAIVLILGVLAAIGTYIHVTFKSIVFNSGICLELYKVNLLDRYTAVVYVSFLSVTLTLPLLMQLISPLLRSLLGLRYDIFSRTGRLVLSVLTAAYFVIASSYLGFQKEQNRVEVWANRLAMDRDIALEIQLRAAEGAIAADGVIGTLSVLENSYDLIRGRIANSYLTRISQDYDISALVATPSPATDALFNERIRGGVRLSENSHFFYSTGANGRARYSGLFTYYTEGYGSSSVFVLVESKSNRENRGYLSLLGLSEPGRVSLPPVYSYARYVSGHLVLYKGDYAYPTLFSDSFRDVLVGLPKGHVTQEGYLHFIQSVSEDEQVVISREKTEVLNYIVEGVLFAIVAYLLLSLMAFRVRRRNGDRHYFRTRISVVLYMSLILTLVAMAAFSVYFVYRRNNADMQNIMTSRITTLQSMLQGSFRGVVDESDLRSTAARTAIEQVGNDLKCDITLFTPDGRMVLSTTPEVYDRMIAVQHPARADGQPALLCPLRAGHECRREHGCHRLHPLYRAELRLRERGPRPYPVHHYGLPPPPAAGAGRGRGGHRPHVPSAQRDGPEDERLRRGPPRIHRL